MKGREKILMAPGPVDIPAFRWAALEPMHHRSERFREIVCETSRMLGRLAGCGHPAYLFTSSGTGAMESAIANLADPGSKLLAVSAGKFGTRWRDISGAYGLQAELMIFEEGERIDPGRVAGRVREISPDLITLTHVESSTGLLVELEAVLAELPEPRPLVIVDAVASLGSEEVLMDEWGIDLLVGAGQKALAAPPGVSFAIAGERARKALLQCRRSPFYFSYSMSEEGSAEGDTPFTPAVQGIQILHDSLKVIMGLGRDAILSRHREASGLFMAAAEHLALKSYPRIPSSSVQVLALPEKALGRPVLRGLEEKRGLILSDGQGKLKGKVVRTGFLGLYSGATIAALIQGLADEMEEAGCPIDRREAESLAASLSGQPALFSES